jgi:hypothetical protein
VNSEIYDEPTVEQAAVINTPADRRLIVLAGPGTGKTFVLVRRVGALVAAGFTPLVLSFTRSVVREMHRRLRETGHGAARYVRPATFDSFATRFLTGTLELAGYRNWENAGYEGRIAAANSAIDEIPAAADWIAANFSHLVVDEVQDLTGHRGQLVRSLCDVLPSFSLFGDPAQGIYGWQRDADEYSADHFLSDVHKSFPDAVVEHLTFNHRVTTDERRQVADLRAQLLDRRDAARHHRVLRTAVDATESLGNIATAVHLVSMYPGHTAILCRTNVEALMISEQLYAAGVDHSLRRAATDRAAAPWIAQVARGRRGALSHGTFERLYAEASLADGLDQDDAWNLLATASGADDRIVLDRVADALRMGRLPDELTTPDGARLVVSTIHRAKGLEFDNVVMVQSDNWREDVDIAEEARVMYVALTRARTRVAHVLPLKTIGWREDQRVARWYRCRPHQQWMTLGFEISGGDAHFLHPAGSYLRRDDVVAIQGHLEQDVRRGDHVALKRIESDDGEEPKAVYAVEHDCGLLGVTSDAFGLLLARRLGARRNQPNRWPLAFTGLRLDGVDTVAGLASVGADHGLGSSGLWLRVRVSGLGSVRWFEDEEAV